MATTKSKYLTISQAANKLNLSKQTVLRLCRAHILPHIQPGREYLILESDLAAALDRPPRGRPKKCVASNS